MSQKLGSLAKKLTIGGLDIFFTFWRLRHFRAISLWKKQGPFHPWSFWWGLKDVNIEKKKNSNSWNNPRYSWRHESVSVYRSTYHRFRASYAPGAEGIWKKGHPGCRVRIFSILIQKLFFWQAFKGVCRSRIFPVASKPQAWTNCVNSCACIFTLVQATPLRMVAFEIRIILDEGYENSAF